MRILHMADLHVGLNTHGWLDTSIGVNTRLLELDRTLKWVKELVAKEQVDLVVIAGDIGNGRNMTGPELAVIRRFLEGLGAIVVLGNHDLEWHPKRTTTVEAVFDDVFGTPQVYPLKDLDLILLPYPSKAAIAAAGWTFEQAAQGMADLLAKHSGRRESVVVAHFTVSGARYNSEQNPILMTGQDFIVSPRALTQPGVKGVMLGHIHGCQTLVHDGVPFHYCGSPMTLTFGEEGDQPKGVTVWDTKIWEYARHVNPYSPMFKTVTEDYEEWLGELMPGTYVRIKASEALGEGMKANLRSLAERNKLVLTGIIEPRLHTSREGAREIAEATSDADVVRQYCIAQGCEDDADALIEIMEEVDTLG